MGINPKKSSPNAVVMIASLAAGFGLLFPALAISQKAAGTPQNTFQTDVRKFILKYCSPCHGGKAPVEGIVLGKYMTAAAAAQDSQLWDRVAVNVAAKTMPPSQGAQPTDAERKHFLDALESTITAEQCKLPDPGRVTIRRLNRFEYENTLSDLLYTRLHVADELPSDDVGEGFDNIGDVLSLSPLHLEKYLSIAEKAVDSVVKPVARRVKTQSFGPGQMETQGGANTDGDAVMMFSNATAIAQAQIPEAGPYKVRVRAWGMQAGPEPARMTVQFGSNAPNRFDVLATQAKPGWYELSVNATPGKVAVAAAFINDYYNPNAPKPQDRDRNLVIEEIQVVGPMVEDRIEVSEAQRQLFGTELGDQSKEAARKILERFAQRAYRRPAKSDEVDRLMTIADLAWKAKRPFEEGIQLGMQAALVSPFFLFRVEPDEAPLDSKASRSLNDFELATRLSYWLWSTMPDNELFALAAQGDLQKPAVLKAQVVRMLAHPKAQALAKNFAGQWLQLRKLHDVQPDPNTFAAFTPELRQDFEAETLGFFETVVAEDRSVLEFIDADWTMLNSRLAKHYGIAGTFGSDLKKVKLQDHKRGGVLTQGSILTVTSNPTRTSPVKRGKWVLENFLGTPPPPPPPGVGDLNETRGIDPNLPLRKKLELHRKEPMCASCHARMDPIGFSLENFDGIGRWRTSDNGKKLDVSVVMSDGEAVVGPEQLRAALMKKKDQFVRNLAQKLLTYATGRGLTLADRCSVDDIVKAVKVSGYKFSALAKAVAMSDPFRKRRGEGAVP